ncbi:MAG: DUF192 domain-containing protein [Methanobrevibacter sp.]|nr:DUF192 domain-containing protein [Methanobrevibacter sp.]
MIKIEYADTFFKRLMGLMFKKDIDYGLLLILKYGSSIHTCFMHFTIDAYFLDENKVIVEKITLKPWKFYKASKKVKYILEVKENTLNLKKGEKIEFI